MTETFDNTQEETAEKAADRKKRSIRDIPLARKTKQLEEKAEKEAVRDQNSAMRRAKKKMAKEGIDIAAEVPHIKHSLDVVPGIKGESAAEVEKLEAEEEAHFEEIKLRESMEKKKKGSKKKKGAVAGAVAAEAAEDYKIENAFEASEPAADLKSNLKTKQEKKTRPRKSFAQKLSIFAVICLIILFALGQTVLAKANVIVTAPTQTISIPETTLPNPIRYQAFTKNTEKKVTVDNIKTVAINKKATGTIILYNNYSSAPYDLIKTTRVQTKNGSVYRLTEDVTIPGKKVVNGKDVPGTVNAKVEADLPGSEYNAKGGIDLFLPGLIAGTAKYINIYAKTASNFGGGASGTAPDTGGAAITEAVEAAKNDAEAAALAEFRTSNPDKIILKDSIQTTTSLGTINSAGGESSVTVRVTTKAIGVSASDIKSAINTILIDRKMTPVESSLGDLGYVVGETSDKALLEGTFTMKINGDIQANFTISPFDLKQLIAKRTIADANNVVLGEMPGADVEISLWPFWKKSLPASNKIEITFQ